MNHGWGFEAEGPLEQEDVANGGGISGVDALGAFVCPPENEAESETARLGIGNNRAVERTGAIWRAKKGAEACWPGAFEGLLTHGGQAEAGPS